MLFSQIEFVLLFAALFLVLLFVKNDGSRKTFLLLASYYFYAYWDYRFLALIGFSTIVDYVIGLALSRTAAAPRRRMLLLTSLVANLGLLGFFKYYNFFIDSLRVAIEPLGWQLGTLDIILPVGISFYTFQTLSYTIDVYRGRLRPCRNFRDFALFVAFFPQLVAGPIVRASEFLPQLETPRTRSWNRAFLGFRQFTFGLFKKAFIADNLAGFVDNVFANAGVYNGVTTWLAVLAYAVQIYCDFSGYSDMAIGIAKVIGYDFNENFSHPYIARNIADFWRRWHISLSTWLRDYLYIPLGGNRYGSFKTYRNLLLTMLLGGLWHGAAWHFVVWGAIHGAALAVHKLFLTRIATGSRYVIAEKSITSALFGWLLTIQVVLVGWVFFRAQSFGAAWTLLTKMYGQFDGVAWYPPFVIGASVLVAATHAIHATRFAHLVDLPADRWYTPTILCLLLWIVVVFPAKDFQPFIYFQF